MSYLQILIPAQSFPHSKSRLREHLGPDERAAISQGMLRRMLTVLCQPAQPWKITVLSNDDHVRSFAESHGAHSLPDFPKVQGHGAQLRAFAEQLAPTTPLLIFMSDLPLFDIDAFHALLQACEDSDILLAPDRFDQGTNAAYFSNAAFRRLAFGHADSFQRHLDAAPPDARLTVHRAPAFQYDIDVVDDLEALRRWLCAHRQLSLDTAELVRWLAGSHA